MKAQHVGILNEVKHRLERDVSTVQLAEVESIFSASNIHCLYRGGGTTSRILSKFRCCQTLWSHHKNEVFLQVGFLVSETWGAMAQYECGILALANHKISWSRFGNVSEWCLSPSDRGTFRYGFCLKHLRFGVGRLVRNDSCLCSIHLPLLGPSCSQSDDCLGYFSFPSGGKVPYVLNPKHSAMNVFTGGGNSPGVMGRTQELRHTETDSTPLFPCDPKGELQRISDHDRAFVVAVALWSRIFSPYV